MIPPLKPSGVLPPFLHPDGPGAASYLMAPYDVTLLELVTRFAQSPERIEILKGLLNYRKQLKSIGITNGFQWIDGSFVEDCERLRSRPPKDVDLVTFAYRPQSHTDDMLWVALFDENMHLFDNQQCKDTYHCDAFYVDLHVMPELIVDYSRYWFGLFSHQRETYLWKGCLRIELAENEDPLIDALGVL